MIKRFSVYTLPESTDKEKFWEWHKEVHGKDVMDAVGYLRSKYVINRVSEILSGDTKVFAFIETCWESKENFLKEREILTNKRLDNGKTISEDWHDRINDFFSVIVEEHVLK